MTTTTAPRPTRTARPRALTVLGTVLAAAGVWLVLSLTGVPLAVDVPGRSSVGLPDVVVAALVAGLAGWALLAALERWTRRARRIWRIVAVGVLAVSLLGPVTSATTIASVGGLIALHVAVGAALLTLPGRR